MWPADGTLSEIKAADGETVTPGAVLGVVPDSSLARRRRWATVAQLPPDDYSVGTPLAGRVLSTLRISAAPAPRSS